MNDDRRKKLWDELMKYREVKNDELLPEERTVKMLMQEYNKTKAQIKGLIEKLSDKNLITKRRVSINGISCMAYTILEHIHNHEQ